MENMKLFPNPPKHYTQFSKEDSLLPPDLNELNKITSFMSFGTEYKMKELNFSTTPVESSFLNLYDTKLIESKKIPNQNINFSNCNIDYMNIFDAIKLEVNFIKKSYVEILDELTVMEDFELNSCLIKYSLQKIYFFISLLKKKKILIDVISYFKTEIEDNTLLENTFSKNFENYQANVFNELKIFKE